jgi:hypothetical protein
LDHRQSIEFLLTMAVSTFAILTIAPRLISWRVGVFLLALFIAHLFFPGSGERLVFAYIYLGLAAALIVADRGRLRALVMGQD